MMYQAIITEYLGPTSLRWARIKATCEAGSSLFDYDQGVDETQNHVSAALKLATRLGWAGNWHGGGLPGGKYVFVLVVDAPAFEVVPEPPEEAAR